MLQTFKNGQGSIILRAKLLDSSSTTGAGLTGLTSASTGLIISTIADNEATATAYTVTGTTIETITTLGTYAAPTATKCRFKEVDATNHKGIYEFQFADARFAVASSKSMIVSVVGATNLQQADFVVQLQVFDPYASVTQTGDSFARLGAPAGASVSADIATKMATYTQPTGFLAATFPGGTVANTTNITAAAGCVLADVSSDAIIADAIWNAATATYGSAGSYGLLIETDLDAAISSRSTYAGGAVASVTAGVTVTTNNDKTGYALTQTFPTNFSAMVITAGGIVDADIESVTGDTDAATRLERVLSGNTTGTVGAASTTTSIVTSAMSPAAAVTDQFKGKIVSFDAATTTAALRGQSTDITASSATGVLTVTALTTAAVSGDVFTVS